MSEAIETMNALKAQSKERRGRNRESSTALLKRLGIPFQSMNDGAHLVVTTNKQDLIDFWPGTGAFICRKGGKRGRGVFKLIRLVKEL